MQNIMFTVRIKPFTGESLWSYTFRLVAKSNLPLLAFLNHIKSKSSHYVQSADYHLIDFMPSSIIDTNKLCKMSGLEVDTVSCLTFSNILAIFGVSDELERSRFLSGMIQQHYCYCPMCLHEQPYHRLIWKISQIKYCGKHSVPILNCCKHCKKIIQFNDIVRFEFCPYCLHKLSSDRPKKEVPPTTEQVWLNEAWDWLFVAPEMPVTPSEVAIRLLYIFSNCSLVFDRTQVEASMTSPSVLPTLLQHARKSLSQRRALHLSFLLSSLSEKKISIGQFFKINVPESFIDSVEIDSRPKVIKLSCKAPWCDGYKLPGTLKKTSTSVMKRKSGETLLYYLGCVACGCEYAFDQNGEMRERTYFIEGQRLLNNVLQNATGFKEIARATGLSADKVRRCLAYFDAHNVNLSVSQKIEVKKDLVDRILRALVKGVQLKTIQSWDCWESYQHFLTHRYSPEVMRAHYSLERPRPSKRSASAVKREQVRQAVHLLLERDEQISIKVVAKIIGVSPESLRGWGCNSLIAKMKKKQRFDRLVRMKKLIYEKTNDYFITKANQLVTSEELYRHLGIQRTVFWRIAPEVTAHVSKALKDHNKGKSLFRAHPRHGFETR